MKGARVRPQLDTQKTGDAYGNIAVAGEITVYLNGVKQDGKHQGEAAVAADAAKYHIHINSQRIGYHHFFEQAEQNFPAAQYGLTIVKAMLLSNLSQQIICPFDGTGEQSGEEGDKGGIFSEMVFRRGFSLEDIHNIAYHGKGVEGETHRQQNPYQKRICFNREYLKDPADTFRQKIEVFEEEKEGQYKQAGESKAPPGGLCIVPVFFQIQRGKVRNCGDQENQKQIFSTADAVEEIAGRQKNTPLEFLWNRPVESKYSYKEEKKGKGIKNHKNIYPVPKNTRLL